MMMRWVLLSLLVTSPAFAQSTAPATGSPVAGILPLVFVFAIFYFLIIRPQSRKVKDHQQVIASIQKNDEVVTGGGIHGKVIEVIEGGKLKVCIAEGVEIMVEQSTISQVIGKSNVKAKPVADSKQQSSDASTKKIKKDAKAANDNS